MTFDLVLADTCLPDYWSGHWRPHIQIPISPGMSMKDIREALRDELNQGAIMGGGYCATVLYRAIDGADDKESKRALRAAYAAINRLRPAVKYQRRFFEDIDDCDDMPVYAFFVFMERGSCP